MSKAPATKLPWWAQIVGMSAKEYRKVVRDRAKAPDVALFGSETDFLAKLISVCSSVKEEPPENLRDWPN